MLPYVSVKLDRCSGSEDEDEEEDDCFITFTTSKSRCDNLFDRGVDMVAQGNPKAALEAFLETLSALQDCQYTSKLLPTLYQMAEAYGILGEVDKSMEISGTISHMQDALEETVKVKLKGRPKRVEPLLSERGDCGSLFLQKADTFQRHACDLEKGGDFEQTLELAESAFRLQQYTLGPQHPVSVRSLRNLIATYARLGRKTNFTPCPGPIIFTSTIESSCSSNQYTCAEGSTTSLHSNASTPSSDADMLHWSSDVQFSSSEALSDWEEAIPDSPSSDLGDGLRHTFSQDVLTHSQLSTLSWW